MIKYIKIGVFILVVLYFAGTFCLGIYTFINAVILYLIFFYLISFGVNKIIRNKDESINYRLFIWSFFLVILIAELVLRVFTSHYHSYTEKSIGYIYVSPTFDRNFFSFDRDEKDPFLLINKKNYSAYIINKEFQYLLRYNSLGLRGDDIVKNDSLELVVAVGDSFTEGIGAPEDSTWLSLLINKLNVEKEIYYGLNGGIGGSDVFYEYYKLENYLLPEYDPRYVVLGVNGSDIDDVVKKGGEERFSEKGYSSVPIWEPIYGMSYIFRAFIHDVLGKGWHLYDDDEYEKFRNEAKNAICNCIENQFVDLSKKNKFNLIVVFSINQWDLDNEENIFESCEKRLVPKGIKVINLYDSFKEKDDYSSFYWPIDLHHNSKGYDSWAEEVYKRWDE